MELRSQTRLLNLPKMLEKFLAKQIKDQWRLVDDFKVIPGLERLKN